MRMGGTGINIVVGGVKLYRGLIEKKSFFGILESESDSER